MIDDVLYVRQGFVNIPGPETAEIPLSKLVIKMDWLSREMVVMAVVY